jgi:hypothetical protein
VAGWLSWAWHQAEQLGIDVASFARRGGRGRYERMILNNCLTMQRIRELRKQPLTPELVLDLHRLVSADTLVPRHPLGRLLA